MAERLPVTSVCGRADCVRYRLRPDAGLCDRPAGRIWVDADLRRFPTHTFWQSEMPPIRLLNGAPYRLSAFVALVTEPMPRNCHCGAKANRRLGQFSFSTIGQGIAIGPWRRWLLQLSPTTGNLCLSSGAERHAMFGISSCGSSVMRSNLSVRIPGLLSSGRGGRRVSWHQANDAVQKVRTA